MNEQLLDGLRALSALSQDKRHRHVQHARPGQATSQRDVALEALQLALLCSPAIAYVLTLDGREIVASWLSDNVHTLLGRYPPVVGFGQWWHDNLHDEDRPAARMKMAKLFEDGHCVREYRFCHQDGSYRWLRDEARLMRDAAGLPLACAGSWLDITECRKLEERLRHAQKLEAVGRVAGGVAHDFNNLLTVISGYAEFMLGSLREDDPLRDHARQIYKAGERAASLSRQLLTFSRKQILSPRILDLNDVLGDMEKMLGRLIGKDVELMVHLDPRLWKIHADVGQLEQVVMNLAINARDAMPQGGRLVIETANVDLHETCVGRQHGAHAGQHVMLAISDNGCGMDSATQAQIFEPFFTTKGPEKGTGLGLATVFAIVKQNGGHVEVNSEVGVGSTFKIFLPRHDEVPLAGKSLSDIKVPPSGTETVLLVENEDDVRSLTRLVLEHSGYQVLEARDPEQALQVCEQVADTIHLLITDVVMPVMNGLQLAESLRSMRPGIKVLYLSAHNDEAIVRHCTLNQDTPLLQKPFSTYALAVKVRDVLDA